MTKKKDKDKINLKKTLTLFEIFSFASGSMISSGLFVLPSIVFQEAGPSIIISYIIAAMLLLPAVYSKSELATAMPKSGGTYFYVHRTLGPLFGTFAGFANWLSISLKSAFALIGIGIFIEPLIGIQSPIYIKIIAIFFTIFFTVLNIFSVKESGKAQTTMVLFLIGLLLLYIIFGFEKFNIQHFLPFKKSGWKGIFTVTGMIFISYGGLTKVASIAEEIKNPGEIIPKGLFGAYVIVSLLYFSVVSITIGLLPSNIMISTLTPISDGGKIIFGNTGYILLTIAAFLSFITTANAGILSASRIPLAMSNDNLLPSIIGKINIKFQTPIISILLTSIFMIVVIAFLDIKELVKVASTMMLILFAFDNLSVILMRESNILAYKPKFNTILYPYLQITGIVFYIILIIEMGKIPLLITLFFFILSIVWYFLYSKSRVQNESAIINIVEKITSKELKTVNLSNELKDILFQRDDIIEDRFDKIIKDCDILDIEDNIDYKTLFKIVSNKLSKRTKCSENELFDLLIQREKDSSTVIKDGVAIPHLIINGKNQFEILIVRSKNGILWANDKKPVYIVFVLAGTIDQRNFHLQALMAIAQILQNKNFESLWKKANNKEELRNLILLSERIRKNEI